MTDSAPGSEPPSGPAAEPVSAAPERAGDFERYALLAALTLVVLCLLVWDRWQDRAPAARDLPSPDRTLKVQIGGDRTAKAPDRRGEARSHTTADTPPAPPEPAPPPAAKRSYVVKDGDNLNGIARRELGSAARANEIAELNGLADPSKLKIGQTLELPLK
jgi:LysM repeat protein